MWQVLLAWIEGVPDPLVYLALGVGAAVENVVPAVPADTFVVLGGFLAEVGDLQARWVFACTWACNVAASLAMVRVGRTHGGTFFEVGWGRKLLNPHQMERMAAFFGRFGPLAIFVSRFLPGFRAVVPVFAGVTRQPVLSVALPLALASAAWYGALVWLGTLAGRNLTRVLGFLTTANGWLLGVAVVVGVVAFRWWWRTRHHA